MKSEKKIEQNSYLFRFEIIQKYEEIWNSQQILNLNKLKT
jgi:hypothetical protein